MVTYVEPGASWRSFWLLAGFVAGLLALDLALSGPDVSGPVWGAFIGSSVGIVGASTVLAGRAWTLRVDDAALTVGRERVPLSAVDVAHLRAVDSGVDAGAPVLGGGWSLPKGRTGLPLKLGDGRTVLVPTRDPARLYEALVVRLTETAVDTPDDAPGSQGTLEP